MARDVNIGDEITWGAEMVWFKVEAINGNIVKASNPKWPNQELWIEQISKVRKPKGFRLWPEI